MRGRGHRGPHTQSSNGRLPPSTQVPICLLTWKGVMTRPGPGVQSYTHRILQPGRSTTPGRWLHCRTSQRRRRSSSRALTTLGSGGGPRRRPPAQPRRRRDARASPPAKFSSCTLPACRPRCRRASAAAMVIAVVVAQAGVWGCWWGWSTVSFYFHGPLMNITGLVLRCSRQSCEAWCDWLPVLPEATPCRSKQIPSLRASGLCTSPLSYDDCCSRCSDCDRADLFSRQHLASRCLC